MDDHLVYEIIILVFAVILARIFYLVHKITTGFGRESSTLRTSPCKTLICIGSGGHTTEMLTLLKPLDFSRYAPRYYFMATNDNTSYAKIKSFEENKNVSDLYNVIKIPRSRAVNQSYITSVLTTVYSIILTFPRILFIRPDLILCNGPGTCIPVCLIAFFLKAAFILDTRIVFVESFCRTKTFSLSGKILTYFADNFLVQWPSLKQKLKRAEYIGQLI